MCGIAGFIGPGNLDDLHAMTRRLAHRGPDGEGFYQDGDEPVFLGHRRLAIVDLEHGSQPMWDQDQSVCVVYNGEIYNHLELRRDLEALGYKFTTDHCDTEVLIHGWKEWGKALPTYLNGMFAYAIWDRRQRLIHLARDKFGEKPLYWSKQGNLFLFASELSALRCHTGYSASTNVASLAKLLAHGFIPAPNSIYQSTHKLPAGSWLEFDVKEGKATQREYWAFRIEPHDRPPDERGAAEELLHLTRQSVKRRLMSDVPLGVFLSGGIDSSTVAALAAEQNAVDTFCIGFEEKSYDESGHAERVARAIGSQHHCQRLTMASARELMATILGRLDEPLSDPSLLPTFMLSKFTRTKVTVALSGDGGDELFAGYDTFAALAPARLYHAIVPRMLHRGLVRLADLLPISNRNMSLDFKIRRSLAAMDYPPSQWNPRWLAPLQPEEIGDILESRVRPEEVYSEVLDAWNTATSTNLVDRTMEFYTRFYLQDNILAKVDRASMMNSLEVRAVFLDPELVDFVRKLPAKLKYKNGHRKRILKLAARNLLPGDILSRPKKGFGIPLVDWLKSTPQAEPSRMFPNVNFAEIRQREQEQRAGTKDHRLLLWTWNVLQRHGMEAPPAPEPAGIAAQ